MLISKIPNLPTYSLANAQPPERKLIGWTLKWRQKQLIVKARNLQPHQVGIEFAGEQWLRDCLQKSPIKIVQIDPAVGVVNLEIWATACKQAKKAIFIRTDTAQKLPYLNSVRWRLKRSCDFLAVVFLLVILSPVILSLIGWQIIKSPQSPLFARQWHVGQRGQLFQLLKFNSLAYGQNLPQLFNVLRGEMSLVGARPWNLNQLSYIVPPRQLDRLPGLTGLSEIEALLPINSISEVHLDYLCNWSLGKDLKIILQTIPRFFSGRLH